MADVPIVKPWGQEDKELLQKLIDKNKVDITKTANCDYINSVRHKYFQMQSNHNFRSNFQSYT
jgi:hypothetical protein